MLSCLSSVCHALPSCQTHRYWIAARHSGQSGLGRQDALSFFLCSAMELAMVALLYFSSSSPSANQKTWPPVDVDAVFTTRSMARTCPQSFPHSIHVLK